MPKCYEIREITVLHQVLEGRGKSPRAAIEDLYRQAEAKCAEKRKKDGVPCSDGTDCVEKDKCRDEAVMRGDTYEGEEGNEPKERRYYARWTGDLKCKCKCKKADESKRYVRRSHGQE